MKKLTSSDVRELCIKKDWFTSGSNYQYEKMLSMVYDKCYSLRDIAVSIYLCSSDVDAGDIEYELRNLMR